MRFLSFFISTLLAGTLTAAELPEQVQNLLNRGDVHYAKFENKAAKPFYDAALAQAPNEFEVLLRMVRVYNDLGEDLKLKDDDDAEDYFEQAVNYARTLVKLFPNSAKSHFELASSCGNLALYKGGSTQVKLSRDIEKHARDAMRLDPNYSNGFVVMGIYQREVADLNWFLKKIAQNILGGLPDGTLEASAKYLKKGVELDPETVFPRYQYGLTLEMLGKDKEAIAQYKYLQKLKLVDNQDTHHKKLARERIKDLED